MGLADVLFSAARELLDASENAAAAEFRMKARRVGFMAGELITVCEEIGNGHGLSGKDEIGSDCCKRHQNETSLMSARVGQGKFRRVADLLSECDEIEIQTTRRVASVCG